MKKLINNAYILKTANEPIIYGCLIIDNDKITYIGDNKNINENEFQEVIDAKNNLVMPGFIDCHTHSPMTILKGVGENENLENWLFNNIIPVEKKLTKQDVYWATKLAILEYLKNGITTINDMYVYHTLEVAKACYESGFRAVIDIDFDNEILLENAYQECVKYDPLVKPSFCCHSTYLAKEEKFSRIIKFSRKYNTFISTHMSETLTEVGNCTKENNLTPVQLLESYGFFDRPCLVYHSVYLDKDDFSILQKYKVNVCTNPASNLKLGSGIAPVQTLLNRNVNVCLGTDGSSSNNRLDMFREMFLVSCLQKELMKDASALGCEEAINMATINGAKALNLNNIGQLKVGNFADLILLNLHGVNNATNINIKSNIVYASGTEDVLLTMINGKVLYENGHYFIDKSFNEIITHCNKIIDRLKLRKQNY